MSAGVATPLPPLLSIMAIKTNKEYLTKTLSRFNITEDDVELILADTGLEGDDPLDVRACKLAMYRSMSSILPAANISEGGYSISWNMEALRMWYRALCKELGVEDVLTPKPKVRNKSNLW